MTSPVPIPATDEANRRECHWYAEGKRPAWAYHAKDKTLWCDECLPQRCGICTVGFYGRGYWPQGFKLPDAVPLPLASSWWELA